MDNVAGAGWLMLVANAAMLVLNWRLRRRMLERLRLMDAETERLKLISGSAGELIGRMREAYGIAAEPISFHPPAPIRLH